MRKQVDADRIARELEGEKLPGMFVPLVFDVTDEGGIQAAATFVSERLAGATLGALINNAGIGLLPRDTL